HFLLTARVPFPGGTLMEKLIRHRSDAPVPVEQLRPDIPPKVAAIVKRLLAKKPTDRYQTPAQLVQALDEATQAGVPTSKPGPLAAGPRGGGSVTPLDERRPKKTWMIFAAGAAVGVFGLILLSCVLIALVARKGEATKPGDSKGNDKNIASAPSVL